MFNQALNRGFDVNYLDRKPEYPDYTLLHHLVARAAGLDSIELMRALLKAGADINVQDMAGATPLAKAVFSQNIPVIKTLLSVSNINITVKSCFGNTALDIAERYYPEVVRLLIPHYMTLKGLSLEAVKKYRGQEIAEEEIKQRLPLELKEELRKQ